MGILNGVKILDHSNLIRDTKSGAIINVDNAGYHAAVKRKRARNLKENRLKTVEANIDQLNTSVKNIEQLLHKLINE